MKLLSIKFILLLSSVSLTVCRQYQITTSTSEQCLVEPCLTLTQFANNTSKYLDSNTTLILEQGNHTLNSQLAVSNVGNFTINPYSISVTSDTTIACGSLGRLDLYNITLVHILNINFIGCVSNRIISVWHFAVENSSFLGHETVSGRALQIIESTGSIVNSLFAKMAINSSDPENGAVQLTRSDIAIIKCTFREINSSNGAVFCEQYSTVNILESTFYFFYYGNQQSKLSVGVLYITGRCTVTIHNCLFYGNRSSMFSLNYAIASRNASSLTIYSSEFRDISNSGILSAANTEMIIISGCVFVNNTASVLAKMTTVFMTNCQFIVNRGSVLEVTRGIINISKSQFIKNTKYDVSGGLLQVLHSIVNVSHCEFRGNKAQYSGGALSLKECNTTIENSVFTSNRALFGGALYIEVAIDIILE